MRVSSWGVALLLGACAAPGGTSAGAASTPPATLGEPAHSPDISADSVPVIEETEATVKPRLLTIGDHRYPASLESDGVTGCVVLRYIVTEEGTADPSSIQVVRRSDPRFAIAAMQMVRTSRYAPGELNGRKVRVWVRQTVRYTDPASGIADGGCLRGP